MGRLHKKPRDQGLLRPFGSLCASCPPGGRRKIFAKRVDRCLFAPVCLADFLIDPSKDSRNRSQPHNGNRTKDAKRAQHRRTHTFGRSDQQATTICLRTLFFSLSAFEHESRPSDRHPLVWSESLAAHTHTHKRPRDRSAESCNGPGALFGLLALFFAFPSYAHAVGKSLACVSPCVAYIIRHDHRDAWTTRARIVTTRDTCGGRPRSHPTVEDVVGTAANGLHEKGLLLSENPDATRDDADACLLYAAEHAEAYYGYTVALWSAPNHLCRRGQQKQTKRNKEAEPPFAPPLFMCAPFRFSFFFRGEAVDATRQKKGLLLSLFFLRSCHKKASREARSVLCGSPCFLK
ncbi:hypothetical protein psal_cds_191 [Pandoravirus salinus]|uniref:Uncharacterized protein n=1 Tax=Pandoravirus salinus TaxID=1349410 RepID=S4VW85_9VIRU|nr:hypothetical protein psal_cds_191 [Pandoravirus salinus]AGO83696.1 hypothetical protein psal_cds_191 [Pandoravirus salinus]